MPTVETSIRVEAPLDRVYAIAKDNASFPEFMPDLQSLTVIESEGNRVVSDYVGTVARFGLKVRWRQEDVWDDELQRCDFRQLSGDYDRLEGFWEFAATGEGTEFRSVLNYEYDVPTLGFVVKKVIHAIVEKNVQNILEAIKRRAETS